MKIIFLGAFFLFSSIFAVPVMAQEDEKSPAPKLNLRELVKSVEFIKTFKAMTDNPEALRAMMRLAEGLKNKQANN